MRLPERKPMPVLRLVACFTLLMAMLAVLPPPAGAQSRKHLLILNSYSPGYKWTREMIQGITEALQHRDVGISQEFMDSKGIGSPEYFRLLYEVYRYKFRHSRHSSHFDAIVATDDDAFDFLLQYRDLLFPGTPVVFCGVNDFQPSRLRGVRLFTGVNESADIGETLDLALKLHPKIRQIVVINDTTTTGRAVHDDIVKLLPRYRDRVSFLFLEDTGMPNILATVRKLPPDSLVFFSFFYRDRGGRTFDYDESITLVAKACPVPIYGTWDFNLGYGLVGGKLTSGYTQGNTAGAIALRILNGERADDIPVVMASPNRYAFDYRQLQRFGIELSALPRGSTIINRPLNLYTVHSTIIWGVVAALAALVLIVILLLRIMALRRRSEDALARKEQRYRALIIATSQIVWLADSAGCAVGDLPSWREYTGQSAEQVRDLGFCQAIHPQERERMIAQWKTAVRTGALFQSEFRLRRFDGEYRYFLVRGVPVREKDGGVREWIGTCTDITERKRGEEALRQSEERFRSAFNQSAVGIIYLSPQGKWLRMNQKFCEIIGYSLEELRKLTMSDLVHPDDLEMTQRLLQQLLEGRQGDCCIEKRYLRKDRSVVWAHCNISMVDDQHGNHLFLVGVIEDITARKKTEEELRRLTEELERRVEERTSELEEIRKALEKRNRELQETYDGLQTETEERIRVMEELRLKDQLLIHQSRMAAMGEMLGHIAHQWRQPLNVLGLKIQELGLCYRFGNFSKELLDANVAKSMEIIAHMSRTIDDFRTFSTPDKQKVLFRADEVIAKTVSLIEESFKRLGIAIEIVTDGDPQIDGYPNEYTQVLLNILMNARDAFQERAVSAPRIRVCSRTDGERAEVTITDNAGGIDEEIIEKIFDAYFTTKEIGKGTGVGLFMSKTIIEKNMGGHLSVRNVDGGVEFRISV